MARQQDSSSGSLSDHVLDPPGTAAPPLASPRVPLGAPSSLRGGGAPRPDGTATVSASVDAGSSGSSTSSGSPTPSSSTRGAGSSTLPGSSAPEPAADAVPPSPPPERPQTRLQHGICKPKTYTDGTVRYGHLAVASEPT